MLTLTAQLSHSSKLKLIDVVVAPVTVTIKPCLNVACFIHLNE